jgi:hypothetical protein
MTFSVNPVIIIPVHKPRPTVLELISIRQCGRCLTGREILFLAPEGLPLDAYKEIIPVAGSMRVPKTYMESISAYNSMMISPHIYNKLSSYSHMIISEPDAIILRDEIDDWCAKEVDYIGAPWFAGYARPAIDAPFLGVGNFGLSLIRLPAARNAVNAKARWYSRAMFLQDAKAALRASAEGQLRRAAGHFRRAILGCGRAGQLRGARKIYDGNCDIFWSNVVPEIMPSFRVASTEDALAFSWEVLPQRCFQMRQGRLPFGIHAWAKYDPDFLIPHLRASGVDLNPIA